MLIVCRSGRVALVSLGGGTAAGGSPSGVPTTRDIVQLVISTRTQWPQVMQPVRPISAEYAEIGVAAFLPGAGRAVLGTWKGDVMVMDLGSGRVLQQGVASRRPVRALAVSPGGGRVAILSERGGAALWHPDSGAFEGRLPSHDSEQLRFRDDHTVVTLGTDRVAVWRLPAVAVPSELFTSGGVVGVAWAPSGRFLAAAAANRMAAWDARDGRLLADYKLKESVVKDVVFDPVEDVAYSTPNGAARITRLRPPDWRPEALGPAGNARRVGIGRGQMLLTASWTTGRRYGAIESLAPTSLPEFLRKELYSKSDEVGPSALDLVIAPGGRYALFGYSDGVILRVTPERDGAVGVVATVPGVIAVDLSADGETLVVATAAHLERRRAGAPTPDWSIVAPSRLVDIALSHDERWVAAGFLNGRLAVYEASDGRLRLLGDAHAERIAEVRFSPDSQEVATGGWDRVIRRWSLATLTGSAARAAALERAWGLPLEEAIGGALD